MPKNPVKAPQHLVAENEELRARLDEAEDTLRAIRCGEVDALVVSTAQGERIFTLKSAERAFRILIEEMNEGALTLSLDGIILYCNRRLGEMLEAPLEKLIGSRFQTWVAPEGQKILQELFQRDATQTRRRQEVTLLASDGALVPAYLSINDLQIEEIEEYFCMVATDLSEHKRRELIVASEKLARELLAASNQSRQALLSLIEDQKRTETALSHSNRALTTLSEVNRALVYSRDLDELFHSICRSIIQQRGYRLAWVGYLQHDAEKSIKIMAYASDSGEFPDTIQPTWAESGQGMGPVGRAARSGMMQLCQDIANDPYYQPWREEALKHGHAASIALPLTDPNGVVFGVLALYAEETQAFTAMEIQLLEEMSEDLAFGVNILQVRHERDLALELNQQQLKQLQENLEDTVRAIAGIVELRDPYTAGHQVRVAELAVAIAKQMGLSQERRYAIHLAGTVHDLGKIQVPSEILSKPGEISDLEYNLIKTHPRAGYDILKGINFPWPIAQMVLQHHERQDGTGYPQGLKGDQILLEARILAVADVVEAMSANRPYRIGLGIETALEEISAQRGIHYDPQVVDACLTLFLEQHYSLPESSLGNQALTPIRTFHKPRGRG
ncbi:MAG: GAF domain-containing protein [Methylococcaceae bacterium]|nr:GAF domain-containing protein [Methylococcaceae bacterium]